MKKTFSILTLAVILSLIASPSALLQEAVAENSTPDSPIGTSSSQSIAGTDSSVNVLVIGGASIAQGGNVPQPVGFTYTNLLALPLPALGAFDTIVLNVGSSLVGCNLSGAGSLSLADLAAIVAFMQAGGKLMIYDSECAAVDYSWLPTSLEFSTNNPGAQGASGTASIVEQNVLSTTGGTNPIDIVALCTVGNFGDACGDANVLVAIGSDLCKDIDAANVNLASLEPVHVYSRSGGPSGLGIMIYNGFDYDDANTNSHLRDLTLFELQANFNPHDPTLDCSFEVLVGGELLSIDSTALILAGAQTNAVWIMSALAVIGSVAFGALYLNSRKN